MSHRVPYAVALTLSLCAAGTSGAFAETAAPQTLRGEVVDPAVYLKEGRHGAELEEQTYEAVDGGQTLALLDMANNTVYLFLAEQPGEDPNELAYDYVNRHVIVTGTVYERGGIRGIVATAIEPQEASPPPTAAAPAAPSAPPAAAQN